MTEFGRYLQGRLNDRDQFHYLLRENPTLLPATPTDYTVQDIDHRRLDEVHMCLSCGQQAHCVFVADTHIGPRWLDLCVSCARFLMHR